MLGCTMCELSPESSAPAVPTRFPRPAARLKLFCVQGTGVRPASVSRHPPPCSSPPQEAGSRPRHAMSATYAFGPVKLVVLDVVELVREAAEAAEEILRDGVLEQGGERHSEHREPRRPAVNVTPVSTRGPHLEKGLSTRW